MRSKFFYFVILIFLIISPQAFSSDRCQNSFASKIINPIRTILNLFSKQSKTSITEKRIATPEENHLLSQSVETLELPERIKNALKNNGIYYVGELANAKVMALILIEGISSKSINKIKSVLAKVNLSLEMDIEWQSPTPKKEELDRLLAHHIRDFNLITQTERALEHADILFIGDLILHTEANVLDIPGIGKKGLSDINTLLSSMNLQLGMANKFHWPAGRWRKLIEAQNYNKELPPILVRRVLNSKEEEILKMFFGIGGKKAHTLKEIEKSLNMSERNVQEVQHHAMRKLYQFAQALHLESIKPLNIKDIVNLSWNKEQIELLIETQRSLPPVFPESI